MSDELIRWILSVDKVEDRVRALAHAMVVNEVDVCGLGKFAAGDMARDVLAALNDEGYDIVPTVIRE